MALESSYVERIDAAVSVPQISALLLQLRAENGTASLHGIIDRRVALFSRPDYAGSLEDARTLARNIARQLTASTSYDPGVITTLSHAATAVTTAPAELVRSAAAAAEDVAAYGRDVTSWSGWPLVAVGVGALLYWRYR